MQTKLLISWTFIIFNHGFYLPPNGFKMIQIFTSLFIWNTPQNMLTFPSMWSIPRDTLWYTNQKHLTSPCFNKWINYFYKEVPPQLCERWFINPSNFLVISTIQTIVSYWTCKPTERAQELGHHLFLWVIFKSCVSLPPTGSRAKWIPRRWCLFDTKNRGEATEKMWRYFMTRSFYL